MLRLREDGREGSWAFKQAVLDHFEDWARSAAALYGIWEINPKTGAKLLDRDPVKHGVAKAAAVNLIDFYAGIHAGEPINSAKFHPHDLKRIAREYDGLGWKDLIESVPTKSRRTATEVRAAA